MQCNKHWHRKINYTDWLVATITSINHLIDLREVKLIINSLTTMQCIVVCQPQPRCQPCTRYTMF